MEGGIHGKVTIIGVDLAKNVFQLHGAAADGTVVFRKKLSRLQFWRFMEGQPACVVAMEGVRRLPLLGSRDGPAWPSAEADCTSVCQRVHQAAEDGMVAALPRRHRNVPRSWCSTPRKGEDGKWKIQ